MKSKQQTPLGYLMGLLDVSLADLGDYLYVAHTSISKWKTGARALRPGSQHFAGIVEYFTALAREPGRRDKMERLFARLYPGQPHDTQQALGECIRMFLEGKAMPSASLRQSIGETGRIYAAQVDVYHGEQGCLAAFEHLLALLAEHDPMDISIVNRLDVNLLDRFVPAMEKGHRLRILLDLPGSEHAISEWMAVLAHPNAEVRILQEDGAFPRRTSCYLLGEETMLVSHQPDGRIPYAAMHTDALTMEQYRYGIDTIWQGTTPVWEQVPRDRIGAEQYHRAMEATLDERTDWLLPSLPYLTMSGELLMEVLKTNGVSGRDWTRILAGSHALADLHMRLYVPVRALQTPQPSLPCLSVLCGKEMRMTPSQARRHMLDTAALLRAGPRLEIVPVQGVTPGAWQHASAYVKRNAYAGYMNFSPGSVRWTFNTQVIEGLMQALDTLAEKTTQELRGRAYVAGMLEGAALK